MRNIFILYMPTGNYEAMVHYEDTIKNKVSQDRIFKYLNNDDKRSINSGLGIS